MMRMVARRALQGMIGVTALVLMAACRDGDGPQAPSGLSYSPASLTYTAGTAITTLSPTVSGIVDRYSVSPALPAGLDLASSSGQISGTPTAATAAADYTVTATNAQGSATTSIRIVVNPAAPSALSYASSQTWMVGTAITALNPTVTGTVSSYSVSPALPAGLAIDAATGVISGTPTAAMAQATYRITASNVSGSTGFDLVLTVIAPPVGQWGTPLQLDSPAGYIVHGARVAADGLGRFVAAWLASDSPTAIRQIRTSRYSPTSGWSASEVAAEWTGPLGDPNRSFALGMAPDGTAVLAYLKPANGFASVHASHQALNGGWTAPVLLEEEDGGRAYGIALAVDGLGRATVMWNQVGDSFRELDTTRVMAARQTAAGVWGLPRDIDFASGARGNSVDPFMAANAGGDVVAAWTASAPNGQFAAANIWRSATGDWSGPAMLTSATTGTNSIASDVGINDAGLAVVSMHRAEAGVNSILIAQNAGGSWSAAEDVDQTTDDSMFPSVAVAPDGGIHVAFYRSLFSGFTREIWTTSRTSTGGTWSTSVPVGANSSTFVRLRSDAGSNVIAVWGRNPGSGDILTSARRPAGGSWGDSTVIESQTTVPSTFLWSSLAVSPDGSAAAAWIEGFNETSTPWVNVYR